MRNFFTLAIAVCSLASTAAQVPDYTPAKGKPAKVSPLKVASDKLSDLPLIDTTPEGEFVEYSRNNIFFGLDFFGGLVFSGDFGAIAPVVYAPDGKVYLKDPFSGKTTGTWLEGSDNGDNVSFSFPQRIFSETYPDWEADPEGNVMRTDNYYAFKLKYTNDGTTSKMDLDLTNPSVTFSKKDGGLVMDGDAYIGLLYENVITDEATGEERSAVQWTGFADSGISLSPVVGTPTEIPAGLKTEQWIMASEGDIHFVEMATADDTVYVKGVFPRLPEAVVTGTIADGMVTFAGAQYMGADYGRGHFAYMLPANVELDEDPEAIEPYIFDLTDKVTFSYDADEKVMAPVGETGLAISSIPQSVFLMEGYYRPEFRWQDSSTPMVPANPAVEAYTYDEDYGMGYISYAISPWSTDGRFLDTTRLYYNFFVDGELLELSPEEYMGLEHPMTNIPYDYEDYDIYFWGDFGEAIIYVAGFDRIGVRSVYVNTDGSTTYSDIVYDDGSISTAVSEVENTKEIAGVEYFSLDGRRLANPEKGICVKRTIFNDGSVRTSKIVKK